MPDRRATRASSAEPSERRIRKTLGRLPRGARAELLQLMASPSEVRADAIRQFHERPETEELAEILIDLESEAGAPAGGHGRPEGLRETLSLGPTTPFGDCPMQGGMSS